MSVKKYIAGFTSRISEKRKTRGARTASRTRRRLGLLEQLEDRRVLATFTPVDVSGLISSINTANSNAEDDVIDLGGRTFTLNAINNDPGGPNGGDAANGLPVILGDGGSSLTITGGTIERDQAGGTPEFRILSVASGADLTIQDTVIRGGDLSTASPSREQGGGIRNNGTLKVIGSTITGNRASEAGGGIHSTDTLTVNNSTISGNTGSKGGGIYNEFSSSTVTNSTISGNTASKGGGIYNYYSSAKVTNSIVAGNTAQNGAERSGGGFTARSSLIGIPSGLTINDILDTTLRDNGGPTLTHALVAGSPAINAGDDTLATDDGTASGNTLSTDQRGSGFARVLGAAVDIGAFEGFVEAPSLVVTTDNDVVDNTDFLTSLREAIAFANLTPDTRDEITFGGDGTGGTTNFTDATPDTITLGGTQLAISSDITITGPGADLLTVSGNNASRVFNIGTGDHDVTFDSLTIADGFTNNANSGAGIQTQSTGTMTVSNSRLIDNVAGQLGGAISAWFVDESGNLVITDSEFLSNQARFTGGAIHVLSNGNGQTVNVTIERTMFDNNRSTSDSGGALGLNAVSGGTVSAVIRDSVFLSNIASASGGSGTGQGGAIWNRQSNGTAELTILNSTFSGNAARQGGAIYDNSATMTLVNSTIVNNDASNDGGGIWTGNNNVTLVNSIVAGNTRADTNADDIRGTVDTANSANNIIGDAGSAGGLTDGTNSNQVGELVSNIIDTNLSDNGGPTPTHALVAGSPAINAGDDTLATDDGTASGNALSTDQRGAGFARFLGGTVDIGAVEYAEAASLVVTTEQDISDPTDNLTSLREAITFANLTPDTLDEITFGDGSSLFKGTDFTDATPDAITLGGTQLEISSDLTISGPGADLLTVSGDDSSRVFEIANGDHDVTLDSLSIADGNSGGAVGGGIRNRSAGTVRITDAVVSDNSGSNSGGGISHGSGTLNLERTTVRNNTAGTVGGGIYITSGTVSLVDSWVADNTLRSSGHGGGIRVSASTLTVIGSTISGNRLSFGGSGGGIHSSGTVAIINSTVSGNTAGTFGGGIMSDGSLTVVNSTVTGNTSIDVGGGIRQFSGAVTIVNSIVAGNTSDFGSDVEGPFVGNANNLIGDTAGSTGFGGSDITGVDVTTVIDTTLADNGGLTPTHALIAGSPAINAGDNSLATDDGTASGNALTTDQRGTGFARILGGTVDIGAFELTPPVTTNVNLSLSSNAGTEAGGTTITVTATADSPVSSDQTVVVDVSGSGITSTDFDQLTATITISAGSNTGTADFTIQDDAAVEPTENATFTLSNPSAGLTLGATTSGTVAITDNDTYDTEVTLVSDVLTITDINGGTSSDDLSISYAGGTYTITDNGGLAITTGITGATGDGTSTVTIPDTGVTGIRFNLLGGDDLVTVTSVQAALSGGFTITGGAGFDRAVVNGTIATTGIGAVNITTAGPIVLNSGSSVTTVNGGITLNANSAGAQTARFIGLDANNALIQTTGTGDIQLLGHGAATDSGASDLYGVDLRGGTRVRSTATGSSAGMITITGAGGNAAANNFGVRILGSTTDVSSVDGDILINGTGGNGSSLNNHGILASGGRIESTGAGENAASIIITGIGGRGPTDDGGVRIDGFQVSSVAGEITITGTGNGESADFRASGASIIGGGTATGEITINANSIALEGTTNVQSTAALTIRPRTAGTTIGIGGGGAGDLNLDDTELGMLSDGFSSITIGDASSGDIDINTATFHDALNLITGGEVHDLTGADLNMSGGDTVTVDGTVTPGQSPGVLEVTGDFAFADNSTFEVEIGGTSPGTANNNHDQIDASGSVSIGSGVVLDLVAVGSFATLRRGGESFKIINRTGGTGTFDGLPEGATISNFFRGNGGRAPLDATITYEGGDGDDVVLTVIHPEADLSVTVDDGQTTAIPGDPVTYTIVVTNDGPYFGSHLSILSTLPASLTGVSVAGITPTGGTTGFTDNSSGNELNIDFDEMSVGGTLTITVTGTIDPGATGSLDVTVNVPYSNDPVAGNNTATDTNTIISAETPSLVVTTDADIEDAFDNLTSLREAIAFANLTPNTLDEITFGGDGTGGTTNFTDATPDTITLGGTELTISSDITITGPGADLLTVSGDDASRVFNIANGDHDVTFDSLSIADGRTTSIISGAGIQNDSHGQVLIADSVLTSNVGGSGAAVYSGDGDLTVRDSQFIDNEASSAGGAILVTHASFYATAVASHVIIERTTFRENRSTNIGNGGGGVVLNSALDGEMTAIIADSTFVDNIGAGDAGALWNRVTNSGTLTTIVTNSTFSGNTAERGGAIRNQGTLTLVNSTIVNNDAAGVYNPRGGGILTNNTNLTLVNSIVAGNTVGGATPDDISGTIDTANSANNIIGNAGSAGGLTDGPNNNQVGVLVTDVIDTTLADNGGPTLTHALIAGSSAINAGDNSLATDTGLAGGTALATDQRGTGFGRILGPAVDIGAFESMFPTFALAVDGPTTASGVAELTFTFQNTDPDNALADLSFTMDLNAAIPGLVTTGLPQSDVLGAGSQLSGTSFVTLTGGTLAAGASGSFSIDVLVPSSATPGTFPITTSDLLANSSSVAGPANIDLVIAPPPTFAAVFTPDAIGAGGVSTLTFTIDNSASALAASGIDFTNNLPAGVVIATPANASSTLTGGTPTAAAGSGVITFTGGAVAAGASGTIQVDVTSITAGEYVNTSGDLTSSSGNSGTANDSLTVLAVPSLSAVFTDDPVSPGGTATLQFTLAHPASASTDATNITFTDDLTAMLAGVTANLPVIPDPPCGAGSSLTGSAGDTLLALTDGTLTPGESCTFSVTVNVPTSAVPGTYTNTTSDVSLSVGGVTATGAPASDDLWVTFLDFGDAPDATGGAATGNPYPTLLEHDGARHAMVGAFLGASRDSEVDGQPNATATGDDTDGNDDEDGVVFTSPLTTGQMATVDVTTTGEGFLNAWIDFNDDGDWADAGEQIFTDQWLTAGANSLNFAVPAGANGGETHSRFRLNSTGGLAPTGPATDGEVEDYAVTIESPIRDVNLSLSSHVGTEAGETEITITARADAAVTGNQTVTVDVTGSGITASDFDLSSTTITILDGQTEGSVTFTVLNDNLVEATETATLAINNPSAGVAIGATDSQNIAITDNDYATLSIDDAEILEGNSGESLMQFTVTLNGQLSTTISPGFKTIDGSASGGHVSSVDYHDVDSHLSFNPSTETTQTKTITIKINGDTEIEPDETFDVELSPLDNSSGLDIRVVPGKGRATGTILNDDVPLGPQLFFKEVLDERVWLGVNDITPDGIVVFAWGTELGETALPQYGITLGIANATLMSLAEGDVDGTAAGIIPIPFTPDGQDYLFQAFELAPSPQVTNVLPLSIAGSPVAVISNNAAPEAVAELPNFSATVGKSFDFTIADETFIDPDSDASLFYNARQSDGSPLPEWLTFDSSWVSFHSDRVPTSGQWTITVTATDNGTPVRFTSTTFILNAVANRSVWQNEANRYDVNQDGEVTPLDALIVLNRINRRVGESELAPQRIDGDAYLDVNGDRDLTPLDALQVINRLNRPRTAQAEAFHDAAFESKSPFDEEDLYGLDLESLFTEASSAQVSSISSERPTTPSNTGTRQESVEVEDADRAPFEESVDVFFTNPEMS